MPAFEYQALDPAGRAQRGVLQADTARAARASLRERGLNPLQVAAVAEGRGRAARTGLRGTQLVLLTRQLATLVASGLPIDEALQALVEGSEGRLRTQVVALRSRVMEGASLAAAMGEFPETFSPLFRASVAAGESAGKLDRVLLRLADYAETRDALQRKVMLALTYPLLLTAVALAVVVGLMVWVVPQVIEVFVQYQQALPLPTRALILASDGVERFGAALALVAFALVLALGFALRNDTMRTRWHRVQLRLLLVGSAVPLLEALGIAAQVVENRALREALARVALRVREGQSFARALADSQEFPPVAVRLIASGEKSGRLDEMLFEAASHQERELDTALGVAMAALGPGVILVVGALVLFIVLAILLPIFELNTLIR
jgi:general secretion pathway protein F